MTLSDLPPPRRRVPTRPELPRVERVSIPDNIVARPKLSHGQEDERFEFVLVQMRELEERIEAKLAALDKKSSIPPKQNPAHWLAHLPAIIAAISALVVSLRADSKPKPPDRSELVYTVLRQEVLDAATENRRLSSELSELRKWAEARAKADAQADAKAAERRRMRPPPSAEPPPPVAPPPPLPSLPETVDELQ